MKTLLESIKTQYPGFVPRDGVSYTFRFIFYKKSDLVQNKKNPCFSVFTGLWEQLERLFMNTQNGEDISSCIAEYVCEFDPYFTGGVYLVKEKEKIEEVN